MFSLSSFVDRSISFRLLSSASIQFLCTIGASSYKISDVLLISLAKSEPCLISHVDSFVLFSGMLNLECVVHPPSSNNTTMPHDATARTIFPCDLILVVMAFHKCLPCTSMVFHEYLFSLIVVYRFHNCIKCNFLIFN
jgi:hypothetical protein